MISKEQKAHDLAIALLTAELSNSKNLSKSFGHISKYDEYFKFYLRHLNG